MATGIPLFPGQTDIDQLGMITSMVGRLCREHMRIVHNHATLRKMRWDCQPQMRNTLECKFPSLTRHQLQFVKVGENIRDPVVAQQCQLGTTIIQSAVPSHLNTLQGVDASDAEWPPGHVICKHQSGFFACIATSRAYGSVPPLHACLPACWVDLLNISQVHTQEL